MNRKKKKKNNENILSKQLDQEQNQRNGDHMKVFQWGARGEEWGERYRE